MALVGAAVRVRCRCRWSWAAVIILFSCHGWTLSEVKSIATVQREQMPLRCFVLNFFILLGYLVQPPSAIGERVSQIGTLFYFRFLSVDALGGVAWELLNVF
jgi:hypothetical protein